MSSEGKEENQQANPIEITDSEEKDNPTQAEPEQESQAPSQAESEPEPDEPEAEEEEELPPPTPGELKALRQQAAKAEETCAALARANPGDQEVLQLSKNLTASRTLAEGGYDKVASGEADYWALRKEQSGRASWRASVEIPVGAGPSTKHNTKR